MNIENRKEKTPELDTETLKEAFASINALKFVLDLNGALDSSIDKGKLIQYQTNLIYRAVDDIYPELGKLVVDGVVIQHPNSDGEERGGVCSLDDLERDLYDKGVEQGLIRELHTGYSSDG